MDKIFKILTIFNYKEYISKLIPSKYIYFVGIKNVTVPK